MPRGSIKKYLLVLGLLVLLSGCSKNPPQPAHTNRTSASLTPIDPNSTGNIRGTISFVGDPPKRQAIDMSLDPACTVAGKSSALSESLVVNQGKLQNVFVYVKDGLGNYAIPKPSQPAVLDQTGCIYQPHVLGMVTGQTLRVLNSDNTGHNVHPVSRKNEQWNDSQEPRGSPIEHTFTAPELMLPIICNKHPWMKMYVNVVEDLFFAVSDSRGDFEISGLPPGTYTIEAVHEKLGTRELRVNVPAHGTATVAISFTQ